MTPRITRTADAMHDMRPMAERCREAYVREIRECAAFSVAAIVMIYSVLSIG